MRYITLMPYENGVRFMRELEESITDVVKVMIEIEEDDGEGYLTKFNIEPKRFAVTVTGEQRQLHVYLDDSTLHIVGMRAAVKRKGGLCKIINLLETREFNEIEPDTVDKDFVAMMIREAEERFSAGSAEREMLVSFVNDCATKYNEL